MKNAFYFILLFLFLKYLHSCPDFLFMWNNRLIRKLWFISKLMTSQPGQQIIALHIFLNISRSKQNQTMNLGQLIEDNMQNILLEKSYTKCAGKLVPDPFKKIKTEHISELTVWNFVFIVYSSWCLPKILKLRCWPLAFTMYNTSFLKKKKPRTNLPISFSAWFFEVNISHPTFH